MKIFVVALALALISLPAWADDPRLQINGTITQGGFITGTVPPGSHVRVSGTEIPLASSGAFAIGLARDASPWLTISAFFPDGTTDERKFDVAKRDWPVQRIDGLPDDQVTPSDKDLTAIRYEQTKIANARSKVRSADDFMAGFTWPAVGPLSGVFGSYRILNGQPRAAHLGLDIAAPEGTPIRAPADGVVTLVAPSLFFNGNVVILDHGLGVTTLYAHLAMFRVIEGQPVHRGDVIGIVGRTGRVTGPHLHFGLNVRGVGLDPAPVLGPQPRTNNTVSDVKPTN
jgi:murein DD-endopeptidase MepM/ murein hydrolase activator NlpD